MKNIIGLDVVSQVPECSLGNKVIGPEGKEYVYAKVASGTILRVGEALYIDEDKTATKATILWNAVNQVYVDASSEAKYFWAQIGGKATLEIDSSVAADTAYAKEPMHSKFTEAGVFHSAKTMPITGTIAGVEATGVLTGTGTLLGTEVLEGDVVNLNDTLIAVVGQITSATAALAATAGADQTAAAATVAISERGSAKAIADDTSERKTITGLGTLTSEDADATITGVGTKFTEQLKVGDTIIFTDGNGDELTKVVDSIASDTSLELTAVTGASSAGTGATFTITYSTVPALVRI